ncbi:SRPBCC domain-containing protein [Muricauda oceani]|uniref:SRPBCC domain-containing protein n=1 Tax=Flagellimonas oceani TaxID=2698672 RepID=A0A6G7J2Y6_9FLAO|nr:SRPBCC domain-containing protein [Allomuricauda oceani]MBW8244001.1 SRPBCC domain-containing protein [Allomuricauda oceani]QII44978.1 SRPBCC domain-containing protein [Allomuricauda oceani]
MEIQKFKITIEAAPEIVWKILWNDNTYRQWAAVFAEGSMAKTDWKEGSKAYFIGPDGRGMVSRIKKNVLNQRMTIEHLGVVEGGIENFESKEAKKWAGAGEEYTLEEIDGSTQLRVEMEMLEEYKDLFEEAWPKALEKIKELAESLP